MGTTLRMTLDSAWAAAWWTAAIVLSVAGGAVVLFWSTMVFERWIDEAGSGNSQLIEPSVVEAEPSSIGDTRAA
ncbi:MAG: hypothetical protein QOG50_708 [Actinomycetota bacterium]|nr:hypothetical protein [Actinomycetota bacterium]